MTYRLKLWEADVSAEELAAAGQRFRAALEGVLGSEAIVLPVYQAYQRIVGAHGEVPDLDALTDAERTLVTQWQEAELAAIAAAFGPNRYMGDAMYEIS